MTGSVRRVLAPALAASAVLVLLAGGGTAAAEGGGHNHGAMLAATGQPQDGKVGDGAAAAVLEEDKPLGNSCEGNSQLTVHDGFQSADPRCVAIEFGEHPAQNNAPSLLIVDAPKVVKRGQAITLKVSTRNLVRDRFLPAAAGGYYKESSFLNQAGLIRGHFHVACQSLGNARSAPAPDRQAAFIAVEDGGGGAAPDTVTVTVPNGVKVAGEARCVAWAGDGSHRMTMAPFANQIIASDAVRLRVAGK
jgi:hypothetical protein